MNIQVTEMVDVTDQRKSKVELVRSTIGVKGSPDKLAQSVCLPRRTYLLLRKLLLIKDRKVLSESEEREVDAAIEFIEANELIAPAIKMTREIVDRYWMRRSRTGVLVGEEAGRPHAKIKRRFDSTLFAIRETCANSSETQIPVMTLAERRAAEGVLIKSINSLWNLFHKIKGED